VSERNDRTIELIGFVQDGFAPNFRKAMRSQSSFRWIYGLGKLDQVYRVLATIEMLAWAKLGETIGYFPKDSAGKLWALSGGRLATAVKQMVESSPHLQMEGYNSWSTLIDVTSLKFWNLFDDLVESPTQYSELWPWFRTQLLLAQRFGKSRAGKMLLACLVALNEDKWCSLISRAYLDLQRKDNTKTIDHLNQVLLEGGTDVDLDIGVTAPMGVELLAGFFLTLDQVTFANEQLEHSSHYVSLHKLASWIRRCRLNFESDTVLNRFLNLAKIAETCDEQAARIVEVSRLSTETTSELEARFEKERQQVEEVTGLGISAVRRLRGEQENVAFNQILRNVARQWSGHGQSKAEPTGLLRDRPSRMISFE
jgi:hypothetical protein